MSWRTFFVLFLFSFSCKGKALSFDWSGWARVDGYYQNSSSHNYYGGFYLTARPEIHIIDGLNINLRADFLQPEEQRAFSSASPGLNSQQGLLFVYGEDSQHKPLGWKPYFLPYISQFYISWQEEFFKARLGRAPYHFGMGLDYSATENPFQDWVSVYNQAVVYLQYKPFYLQPALLFEEDVLWGLMQAGLQKEKWEIEALFRYDFDQKASFVSGFGRYEQETWDIKASAGYLFEGDNNINGVLSAEIDIPADFSLRVGLKAAGALGSLKLHPNHDPALMLWNRFMTAREQEGTLPPGHTSNDPSLKQPSLPQAETIFYQPAPVAKEGLSKGAYAGLYAQFSFWQDSLKVKPLAVLARDFARKKFDYELDLEGIYKIEENLFFSLKGGFLFHKKDPHLALLAQVSASF